MQNLSDTAISICSYVDLALMAVLGIFLSIFPLNPKRRLPKFIFCIGVILTALVGVFPTLEQGRRSNDQAMRIDQAQEASRQQARGVQQVLDKLATELKSAPYVNAAAEMARITQQQSRLQQGLAMPRSQSQEQPLIARAKDMLVKLEGLDRDWNATFDYWARFVSVPEKSSGYRNLSPVDQATVKRSDKEELSFREEGTDKQEAAFYRQNYAASLKKIRAELVPLVPGVSDTSIDYDDPTSDLVGFNMILDDFKSLVQGYAATLPRPR